MTLHPIQIDLFCEPASPPDHQLIGLAVQLPDLCKCGDAIAVIGRGKGMHSASLYCRLCNNHRGWVSRTSFDFLRKTIETFGRPELPIEVRRGPSQPEMARI
jgi:hypothetical protein